MTREAHLLHSEMILRISRADDDGEDDDDDDDGVDRQLVRMGYRLLVRGCKGL